MRERQGLTAVLALFQSLLYGKYQFSESTFPGHYSAVYVVTMVGKIMFKLCITYKHKQKKINNETNHALPSETYQ